MPPPTPTSTSPARIAWSRMTAARTPDAQTLLTVSDETSLGMPALICAWREGICPWPACRTWPMTTCSTWSGSTSARSSAQRIASAPRSVASSVDSPPPSFPIGVRAVPRMTVLGIRATPGSSRKRPVKSMVRDFMRVTATTEAPPVSPQKSRVKPMGRASMRVPATPEAPRDPPADTVAIGVFEDEGVAHDTSGSELQALLDSGEAKPAFRHLAVAHADGKPWLLVGLGARDGFDAEKARRAAAAAHKRAGELGTRALCWEVPHHVGDDVAGALAEGTVLAAYGFDRYRDAPDEEPTEVDDLIVSAHHDVADAVAAAVVVAEAANACRDLQNTPANDMTPTRLAERARELETDGVSVEVEGRDGIAARGMGAFAAVAQGTYEEPALITMRYDGAGASGPVLGLVGKAVTFDSGGISIKPGAKMSEMKFDMSGGAAVVEAVGAIARLGLPVRVVGVVGATENMPSGRSVKPGDIVRTKGGLTVEVNNTDAEGRLVLADCLAHAREQGAERLVDIATLTGGVVVALGSTYAGVIGTDDAWVDQVLAASDASGEELWRLPLHEEYAELVKGRYGDLNNAPEERKASTIVGAEFLKRFAGDVPWAHVDIAGVAWDRGRAYAAKGGNGFGVRLLVELARSLS